MYDVVIVGGSIAGLSAGLVLGRSRRTVLIVDGGRPRNAPSHAVHSYFSRDGIDPAELLTIGREQLKPYGSVEFRHGRAVSARRDGAAFEIRLADGALVSGRRLLITTGVTDLLPPISGLREMWGRGVFHCPYCHGWEVRDEPIAVCANGEAAVPFAALVHNWSRDLVLLTNGPANLSDDDDAKLSALSIPVREEPLASLEPSPGGGLDIHFEGNQSLPLTGMFMRVPQKPNSDLAVALGCQLVNDGMIPGLIRIDADGQTTVPGVYAAGDITTLMQQAIFAAAAGANAAARINHVLVEESVAELALPAHR